MQLKRNLIIAIVLAWTMLSPRGALAQSFGSQIDVLGFKMTIEDGGIVVEDDKLVLKGTASLDLTPALGDGAIIKIGEMSIDHETTVKLKSISTPEINLGAIKAKIAPDDIVLEKIIDQGVANAYINMNVILLLDIAGEQMQVKAIIPITTQGIKDAVVKLEPAEGKESFLDKSIDDVVTMMVNSGTLEIENKAVKRVAFDGSLDFMGVEFKMMDIDISIDKIFGKLSLTTPGFSFGAMPISFNGLIAFDFSPDGFHMTIPDVTLNLDAAWPDLDLGIGELRVPNISINMPKAGFPNVELPDVSAGLPSLPNFDIGANLMLASFDFPLDFDLLGLQLKVKSWKVAAVPGPDKLLFKLTMSGAVISDYPAMTLPFENMFITTGGLIGVVGMTPSVNKFDLYGMGVEISSVDLWTDVSKTPKSFGFRMDGDFVFNDSKLGFKDMTVSDGNLSVAFDVSKEKPLNFPWFEYLKLTGMDIRENMLVMSGEISVPDPFEYKFEFADMAFDPKGLPSKLPTKDEAEGAVTAVAEKAWDKVTSPDLTTIVNTNTSPLKVGDFNFYIDAITVPNLLKVAKTKTVPDTLLKLYMRSEVPLGDKKIPINLDGLEVTKSGVKDMRMEVKPPPGESEIYKLDFFGWAQIAVTSAYLSLKDGKFEQIDFKGKVVVDGREFAVALLRSSKDGLEGQLEVKGDPYISLGGLKVVFQGSMSFRTYKTNTGAGAGGGGPPGGDSHFELTFNKISLDFSSVFGSSASISADVLKISDGNVYAEMSSTSAVDISGFQIQIKKVILESKLPASGARTYAVTFSGAISLASPQLEVAFNNFKITSGGDFSGDIAVPQIQEFTLLTASFGVKNIHIEKKSGQPLGVFLSGYVKLFGEQINFTDFTYSSGKVSVKFDLLGKSISLPMCSFIKITALWIEDNALAMDGRLDVPAPLSFSLVAKGVKITSAGLVGGVISLENEKVIPLGVFNFVLKTASIDLSTMYLSFSGEIRFPDNLVEGTVPFSDVGMSLAQGGGAMDTSYAKTTKSNIKKDKKHNLDLSVQSISMGRESGNMFVVMTGSFGMTVGGYGFNLNFENLKIFQDASFSVGKVTGGIKVATFSVEVTKFEINDRDADPNFVISGGLSLPMVGGVAVENLRIYKSGKISIDGISFRVDYKAYQIEGSVSYKDSEFKGEGSIIFLGKGLHVAVLFSPVKCSIDIDVYGLKVPLFPGVFLEGIGGGFTYEYDTHFFELRLRGLFTLGDANVLSGAVQIAFNTDGIIKINGELNAIQVVKLAEIEVIINIPEASLTGTAKMNFYGYGGFLKIECTVNMFFSPNTWYIRGTAVAKILFGLYECGHATLDISSKGFFLDMWVGMDLSVISGSATFNLAITADYVTMDFKASARIDLYVLTVSGGVEAHFSTQTMSGSGSVYLEGCIGKDPLEVCASCTLSVNISRSGISLDW